MNSKNQATFYKSVHTYSIWNNRKHLQIIFKIINKQTKYYYNLNLWNLSILEIKLKIKTNLEFKVFRGFKLTQNSNQTCTNFGHNILNYLCIQFT